MQSSLLWLVSGGQWAPSTQSRVYLFTQPACLVEPCALSMPVRVQQQAHPRHVRGHPSQIPVVRTCAKSSSSRAACSVGFLMVLSQSQGRCDTQPDFTLGLSMAVSGLRPAARTASSCSSSRRTGLLRSWCRHRLWDSGMR